MSNNFLKQKISDDITCKEVKIKKKKKIPVQHQGKHQQTYFERTFHIFNEILTMHLPQH